MRQSTIYCRILKSQRIFQMQNVSIFKFEESFTVRTVIKDNEPWFVAKDVCDVLGLTNPSEALKSLDNDEKTTLRNSEGRAGAGAQCFNIINESGLYALVIRSNKPNARKFRRKLGDCNLDVEKLLRKLSVAGYDVERELAELAYLCATVNRCRHAAYEFMAQIETMNHHARQLADMSYNTTYRFGRNGRIGVPETVTA